MGAAALPILAGVQLTTSYLQSEQQRNQAEFNADMMKRNAREAERYSKDVIAQGEKQAQKYKEQGNMLIGRQRASFGSSGVDVNFGTAKAVQDEARMTVYEDMDTIRTNAFLKAMGYQNESANLNMQASMTRQAGQANANMTLLAGGLGAAKTYYYGGK